MLDKGTGGGSGGFSSDGLIDPSLFAAQSSDMYPSQIEESATRLRAMGKSVHTQVGDIDSSWGGLKSHYEAPEQQRVYDLMDPAVKSARELKSTLSKAAGYLDLYASTLHCLKPRLKDLERRAEKFRADVICGVPEDPFAHGYSNDISIEKKIIPWDEDPESLRKNENLLKEYGGLHEEISTAATTCANSINDLVESWNPGEREAVTAEAVTNPEQPMPWGSPVEEDLGWVGDLGQGVLNVPVNAAKDMSPLVLGYNPDSGEDFKWRDLKNWGVRWEAVKGTADFYGSTAQVAAAGWTQGGARLLGKEAPAWTRTKDIQEKYDRTLTGWGSAVKYDHQAAKAGGDGWHEYKGDNKVETWSEMGTTLMLTVGTGGVAAAAKGGTKSVGAGQAARGADAPDVKPPRSHLPKGAAANPLHGIDASIDRLGGAYPSGHGPGKATNSLLDAVDDGPPSKRPDAPVSNSIDTSPRADSSPDGPRAQDGASGAAAGPDGSADGASPDLKGDGSGADRRDAEGRTGSAAESGGTSPDRRVAWTDDFSEKASHKDSPDPQSAAQAKLNARANRFVDDNGLTEPMDVWDTGKIRATDRGFVVEAANGGNLPGSTSPWDKLDVLPDGREVATSIKSMDPRLPSYTRGNAVYNQLRDYIDAVDGAGVSTRGRVRIVPDELDARALEFYVPPDGLTPKQSAQVDRARHYAESKGIEFILKEWP